MLYFRIDINEVIHERRVYQLIDFLGDLGGINEVLMGFFCLCFAGYTEFHSGIETMIHLYSDQALYQKNPFINEDSSCSHEESKDNSHEKSKEKHEGGETEKARKLTMSF